MNGSVMQMRDNGEFESLQPAIGTDAHRVQTARWVLETFEASTPVYKQAQKVIAAYLAGKPLPGA